MKKNKVYILLVLMVSFLVTQSCGPVFFSSSPGTPPPPWFYPNRIETVRYVYFPDYLIYYDLSLGNYIYLENGIWITVNVLPPRFNRINLRRSRYIKIRDYNGDNIRTYHRDHRSRYYRSRNRNTTTRNRTSVNNDNKRNKNTTTRNRTEKNRNTRSKSTRNRSRDSINL